MNVAPSRKEGAAERTGLFAQHRATSGGAVLPEDMS